MEIKGFATTYEANPACPGNRPSSSFAFRFLVHFWKRSGKTNRGPESNNGLRKVNISDGAKVFFEPAQKLPVVRSEWRRGVVLRSPEFSSAFHFVVFSAQRPRTPKNQFENYVQWSLQLQRYFSCPNLRCMNIKQFSIYKRQSFHQNSELHALVHLIADISILKLLFFSRYVQTNQNGRWYIKRAFKQSFSLLTKLLRKAQNAFSPTVATQGGGVRGLNPLTPSLLEFEKTT